MKFSVVIPLYNKAPYIAKAIRSVLAQTFGDYELIVMDDGSKDDSFGIALREIEGKSHCHIFREQNQGVSMARNNAVALSLGDFLCFLDADDWWEPTFLEEMSKLIDEFPDAGIYGTGYTIVNETRHKTRVSPIGVEQGFEKGYINYCQVYARTLAMPLWTGAICIPKYVFHELDGFNLKLKMGEDFDLWVRIAIRHKVAFLNKPLAYYNQDVEVQQRAIGTLSPPQTQFAFCASYLKDDMERNAELRYIVETVQIICLRNYYLSSKYHAEAKSILNRINLQPHIGKTYTDYLRRPVWLTRLSDRAASVVNKWRYGR